MVEIRYVALSVWSAPSLFIPRVEPIVSSTCLFGCLICVFLQKISFLQRTSFTMKTTLYFLLTPNQCMSFPLPSQVTSILSYTFRVSTLSRPSVTTFRSTYIFFSLGTSLIQHLSRHLIQINQIEIGFSVSFYNFYKFFLFFRLKVK